MMDTCTPTELNENSAELIGMHTGDGTLYKTKYALVWEIRGSLSEKEYYWFHVKPLLETIFEGLIFTPKFRSGGKNGCFGVQTCKKEVTRFFINSGFLPGHKSHSVSVPNYIFEADARIENFE